VLSPNFNRTKKATTFRFASFSALSTCVKASKIQGEDGGRSGPPTATTMAADDNDNDVNGNGVMGDDDGDGATGDDNDNDNDGTTMTMATARWATA